MIYKTYTELSLLPTFVERYRYARAKAGVGEVTFGGRRELNQRFYRSSEWKRVRDVVIVRDGGCDLGVKDRPISGLILIHHLNPIEIEDIESVELLLNPEYLICVSHATHNALHYGDESLLAKDYTPRFQNDTCPWRW